MAKKLGTMIHDVLFKKATTMCEKYCKYGEQYKIDQQKYDDKNPTWFKHCQHCPMNDFFNDHLD